MESLEELFQFLDINQRPDVKAVSLSTILGLTGSTEGIKLILNSPKILDLVIKLTQDKSLTTAIIAIKCLINITSDEQGSIELYKRESEDSNSSKSSVIVSIAVDGILDENSEFSDLWTMILNNLTVVKSLRQPILSKINDDGNIIRLMNAFCKINYNKKEANLDLLGTIFYNLSSIAEGRAVFCQDNCRILEKILPFISYKESLTRRHGAVETLKNICLDSNYHEMLLSNRDDILSCILYQLAGPEQFTDEENEKFPVELQYLDDDKKREENPEIRISLLEILLQFCAMKNYREILRLKGTYEILREYHKWENNFGKNKKCILACENVIHILIKKEEEIGVDNLKEVEVPNDLKQKFTEDDEIFLKTDE